MRIAIIALAMLCGCRSTLTESATDRANAAADGATRSEIRAAELEANAAQLEARAKELEKRAQASKNAEDYAKAVAARAQADAADAETAAAKAKAETERKAALAEDERRKKIAAEERAAVLKAQRDNIGWWLTVAGSFAIAGSAIVGVIAWKLDLGKLGTALTLGLSAGGAVALALGLAWQWLPIAAGVLLLIAGIWLVLRLRSAGKIIDTHADEAAHADPTKPDQLDLAKSNAASSAIRQGLTGAVAWLRGKPIATAKKKAAEQLIRVPA